MFKKIPVFALAFVSGSALAGPVGTLLGNLTGSAPAPVALPGLGSLPTQQLGQLTGGLATALTNAAPLPGLGGGMGTEATAPGGIAVGVLDGDNTGNGGVIGVAALSGENSGQSTGDSGLGIGVLNENDTLHIGGCFMGTCMGDGQAEDPTGFGLDTLGTDLSEGLRDVLIPLTTDADALGVLLNPVGDGTKIITDEISTGIDLFGGPTNNNAQPDSLLNAGVVSGNNSGSGGTIGVAVLSTATENGSTGQADSLAVGVLNGKAAGPTPPPPSGGPIGGNPEETAGGTVIGENSAADAGDRNALCSILTKDSRGKVIGKTKVRCGALKSPNV